MSTADTTQTAQQTVDVQYTFRAFISFTVPANSQWTVNEANMFLAFVLRGLPPSVTATVDVIALGDGKREVALCQA